MAAMMMKSSVMVKAPAAPAARPAVTLKSCVSMKVAPKIVSAAKVNQMQVWREDNNKQFETFSFLPPLTKEQIAKQIDYIVNNGWVPCLEFASAENAYVSSRNCDRVQASPGYYDNRYWTMWKLPMFGCSDASQVLKEIAAAAKALPTNYIRIAAFDNVRQVQIASFLVHRPASGTEYRLPNDRQIS